jgi:hypothetical protein
LTAIASPSLILLDHLPDLLEPLGWSNCPPELPVELPVVFTQTYQADAAATALLSARGHGGIVAERGPAHFWPCVAAALGYTKARDRLEQVASILGSAETDIHPDTRCQDDESTLEKY